MSSAKKILQFDAESLNLSSEEQWNQILSHGCNPGVEIIIYKDTGNRSNLLADNIKLIPPFSLPGKLLAFLFHRFKYFNGAPEKGLIIVSSDLSDRLPETLEAVILEIAHLNNLEPEFLDWIENSTRFCERECLNTEA